MKTTPNIPEKDATTRVATQPAGSEFLLASLPGAVCMYDADGKVTFFNAAAETVLGYPPRIGKTLWETYHILDAAENPANATPASLALKGQKVKDMEMVIETPEGLQRHILSSANPLLDASGKVTGVVEMMQDYTERKMEKQLLATNDQYATLSEILEEKVKERTINLRKSEERYHKMVEEVQDYAILLLDPDGYIVNWNLGAEKIKGYTEEEIIGKNFRLFYLDHDRESKLPEKLIQQAHETGRAMHEGWRVRKDGSTFWGSVVITALHDDDNNIIGFTKVTRDLTERKLADDRMRNYALEIEFRNKQLEEYAYIASHDLQEPLRKIQIFAEMLETNLDKEQIARRHLDKINSSARRMSQLIKDVLRYSQLSRADELFETVDLNNVINTIRDDFELLIEERRVRLETNELPSVPGIPIQLHQLFANLINNAIKFSSNDPLIIIHSAEAAPEDIGGHPGLNASRRYTKITVTDNGVGFDQQYGEQVFRMFKRLSENSGTGIGLALCKRIVENHGGSISVVSEPGKGTQFTIMLPID